MAGSTKKSPAAGNGRGEDDYHNTDPTATAGESQGPSPQKNTEPQSALPTDRDEGALESKVPSWRPFPVEALPEPIRGFVSVSSEAIGCDPSYVALPLLSALASAIGNTRRIQLKHGWTEPAIVWTAMVGESGTLKTPPFKLVMRPIRERQDKALKEHRREMGTHEREVVRYEKKLALWKKNKSTTSDPPEQPEPPHARRYIVADTTVEALAPILLENWRGVLLARDELSGWIGSFDRYAQGKGADASHWVEMHSGESITVDRKTGTPRTIYVPSAAVSVAGGIQPGVLARSLGTEHRENGLAPRLLLAYPPRKAKRWTETEIPPEVEERLAGVLDRLYGLEPEVDDKGENHPVIVPLTEEAEAAWVAFYNAHADEQAELTGDLSAVWSKLEGYTARLALVVHLVRWAADDPTLVDADAIDAQSIASGVALTRWFGNEARRVYAVLSESDEERRQRHLVELIQRRDGRVSVREWQRARSHKTADDARAELDRLAEAGFGEWLGETPPGPAGGRASRIFLLRTELTLTQPSFTESPEGVSSVSEASEGSTAQPADEEDRGAAP